MKLKKYIIITAAVLSTSAFLTSCGEKKSDDNTGKSDTETTTSKRYPLDVCIVSGEELGSMGEPYVFVHKGQKIKMCCDKCMPKFNKNPEKYLAKLKVGTVEKKPLEGHKAGKHNH